MMKIDADAFMNTHPVRKRVSILEPFRDEIFKLRTAGYSVRQISEFLALNNVTISQNALTSFIKTRQKTTTKKAQKADKAVPKAESVNVSGNEKAAPAPVVAQDDQVTKPAKKPERNLVEKDGRIIDVNYKPSWAGDDINLKDLI